MLKKNRQMKFSAQLNDGFDVETNIDHLAFFMKIDLVNLRSVSRVHFGHGRKSHGVASSGNFHTSGGCQLVVDPYSNTGPTVITQATHCFGECPRNGGRGVEMRIAYGTMYFEPKLRTPPVQFIEIGFNHLTDLFRSIIVFILGQ